MAFQPWRVRFSQPAFRTLNRPGGVGGRGFGERGARADQPRAAEAAYIHRHALSGSGLTAQPRSANCRSATSR